MDARGPGGLGVRTAAADAAASADATDATSARRPLTVPDRRSRV